MEPDIQVDWNRVAFSPAEANRIYYQTSTDYLNRTGEDPMEFARDFDAYFKDVYGYSLPFMIPDTSDVALQRLEAFISFTNMPREYYEGFAQAA
jgi:hypothetical protein